MVQSKNEFPDFEITLPDEIGELNDNHLIFENMNEVMDNVVTGVRRLWTKSNSLFMPPITVKDNAIKKKLMDNWGKAADITRRRITNQNTISSFEERLDRLLDITVCQCVIEPCNDACSLPRCSGVHICCDCSREIKIPALELNWILD